VKLGYSTWGMPTVPIDIAIAHIADLGFDGMELSVLKGWSTELSTLDGAERRRIRTLAEQRGLELDTVFGHNRLLSRDAEEAARDSERCRQAVDLCADLAIDGQVPSMIILPGGKPQEWEASRDLLVERLGALVAYGEGRGIPIALEPHVSALVDRPERVRWLFDRLASPYLTLNFDISHFEVQGVPMAESIAALAPLARHTHVKDERGRAPDHEFLIPGEGEFDYVTYLRLMREAGYDGYITVEVSVMVQRRPNFDPLAAAAQSYRTLARAFETAGMARGKGDSRGTSHE
jgi:sugar phosphate isomerase/epimerase